MIVIPRWCEFDIQEGDEIPPAMVKRSGLPFAGGEAYWMPQRMLMGDEPPEWSMTKAGDLIRIPLAPYLLPGPTIYDAMAAGLQIGALALHHWHGRPHATPLLGMVLAIGANLPQPPEGQRHFIGLALVTTKDFR